MSTAPVCVGDKLLKADQSGGMRDIPIILLAAGGSRRMGGIDKLMQDIDGEPLLRRTARRARAVGPVWVALPPAPHQRHGCLKDIDVRVVEIPDADEGMNASLRRTLQALPDDAAGAMILLADLPDLTVEDLETVVLGVDFSSKNLVWRGMTEDGKPGHPVVFSRELFPDLLSLTGDAGAQTVVRDQQDRLELIQLPGQHARTDLDTPEAWKTWRSKQKRQNV